MALAALPLAEMAGSVIAPGLESMIGKETYSKLAPLAKEGLHKVLKSKAVSKIGHKLGNKLFGKSKTARKLMKGASKVAGIATGKGAQKLVKSGLGIGQDLGLVSGKTADNILGGYNKALSLHDKLSNFNQPKDKAIVQQVEAEAPTISPQAIADASNMVMKEAPTHAVVAHSLPRADDISEKEKKLGDILELMGIKL